MTVLEMVQALGDRELGLLHEDGNRRLTVKRYNFRDAADGRYVWFYDWGRDFQSGTPEEATEALENYIRDDAK